jgi:endonuclease YncB( thermonuclease family)
VRRFLPVLFLLAMTRPTCALEYSARVVGVSDGDTLTVLQERSRVHVRLYGIDAPEKAQDEGSRAKQLASSLALGEAVTVRVHDTDRYGRTVAEVVLPDGRSLNREMVAAGMAWWYRQYAPADGELARLEAEARAGRRGLWSQSNPVPPWSWRKAVTGQRTRAVVGNRRSRLYHNANCRGVATMSEGNRVGFDSAEQAGAAGYRPAADCRRETAAADREMV